MDLYQANILEHYKRPHHRGKITEPSASSAHANPLCGDRIEITIKVEGQKITDVKYDGEGCVLSQAAASILLDELVGKDIKSIKKWTTGDLLSLLKIEVGPNRQKCASLSLDSVQDALSKL